MKYFIREAKWNIDSIVQVPQKMRNEVHLPFVPQGDAANKCDATEVSFLFKSTDKKISHLL